MTALLEKGDSWVPASSGATEDRRLPGLDPGSRKACLVLCFALLTAPGLSSAQIVPVPAAPGNSAAAVSGWVAVIDSLSSEQADAFKGFDLTEMGAREALARVLDRTHMPLPQDPVELSDKELPQRMFIRLIDKVFSTLERIDAFSSNPSALPREKASGLAGELADIVKIRSMFSKDVQERIRAAAGLLRKTAVPNAENLVSFKQAGQWAKPGGQDVLPIKTAPVSPRRSGLKGPADASGSALPASDKGEQPFLNPDAEFEKLFQKLLASGEISGRIDAFNAMTELGWTPQRRDRLRGLFLTTDDADLMEMLRAVFFYKSFGFSMENGFPKFSELLAWLYPEDYEQIAKIYRHMDDPGSLGPVKFSQSVFMEPALIHAWGAQARRLKALAPEAYAAWLSNNNSLEYDRIDFGFILPAAQERVSEDGYQWPYPLEKGPHNFAEPQPWIAEVSQTLLPPEANQQLKKRYALFNRLIDSNFQVLGSMAGQADSLTRASVKLLLSQAQRMEDLYHRLRGDSPEAAQHSFTQTAYDRLKAKLRRRWQGLLPEEKLAGRLTRLIFSFDESLPRRSLNALINWMHQKAIELFGKNPHSEADTGTFRSYSHSLRYVYVGDEPLYSVLPRSAVLKRLLMNLHRIKNSHLDKLFFTESRLQLHAKFGYHTAEIYADLSEPDEGGMLRIRYLESGVENGGGPRMHMIAAVLERFGMSVKITGDKDMTALWDKDHGLDSSRSLADAIPFILQCMHDTKDIDLLLSDLVGPKRSLADVEGIARKMGGIYFAEGEWPSGTGNNVYRLYNDLEARAPVRKELRERTEAELKRLGLPPLPADIAFGQRTIQEFLTRPMEEAAARGEFAWDGVSKPHRSRGYAPLDTLAAEVLSDPEKSALLASVLESLDDSILDYAPIGMIGALRAERAQLRLDDGSILTIHALRELASNRLAYAQASVWRNPREIEPDKLKFLLRKYPGPKSKKGGKASSNGGFPQGKIGTQALMALLQESGYDPRPGEALSASQQKNLQDLLKAPVPAQSLAQAEAFGLPASPGKGEFSTGPLLFDKKKQQDGAVLAVPYTSPDDLEAISKSAAVITTGGGSLSHAAITTRELGLPSVILFSARWKKEGEKAALGLRLARQGVPHKISMIGSEGRSSVGAADLSVVEDPTLREGDLVRVYGKGGKVALIARAGDASLQSAYRALEALRSGAKAELEWDDSWDERAERFMLEEARSDFRYSAQKGLIFEALRRRAKHLSAKELAALAPAASDAAAGKVSSQAADNASAQQAGPAGSAVRKPLWRRLEQKLRQSANKDRLSALLRRMIRRDGARAGEDPAYRRLSALDREAREKRMLELILKEPSFLDLSDIDDDMKSLVGGKSAKLGEMLQALRGQDAYVPEGLALTIYAYKRFLKETGLEDKVRALAMELDALLNAAGMDEAGRSKEISRLSERIRQVLMSARLDPKNGVGRDILEALKPHGFEDEAARWSVRSSAIQEDSDDAAFAGAAESYLNLKPEEVLDKVVENWASFWLPRGILYRQRQGLLSVDLLPATLIQKMAPAQVSGVIFTRNPVNGTDEVVINAAYGLGEGVVSGQAAADVYMTRKWDGQESELPHVARKRWQVENRPEGFGTRLGPVPPELRGLRALSLEQTRRLTRVAAALEKRFGKAMDIEFSLLADGTIVILQARPITAR
ncbi:MAG: PEP/pyruvate-binding domain-containing protein [Elusimicrobiota bacterium]